MRAVTAELVESSRIAEVWTALGGGPLRAGRGKAFWRGGDSSNVSINERGNVWYDFARGEGGGILDLVQRIQGCSRREALEWLAHHIGVPLDHHKWTAEDRREWGRNRARAEAEAKELVRWRSDAIARLESLRNAHLAAYHKALRLILSRGLDHPRAALAADVAEVSEVRYQELDAQLDEWRQAPWPEILRRYRAGGEAAA